MHVKNHEQIQHVGPFSWTMSTRKNTRLKIGRISNYRVEYVYFLLQGHFSSFTYIIGSL